MMVPLRIGRSMPVGIVPSSVNVSEAPRVKCWEENVVPIISSAQELSTCPRRSQNRCPPRVKSWSTNPGRPGRIAAMNRTKATAQAAMRTRWMAMNRPMKNRALPDSPCTVP